MSPDDPRHGTNAGYYQGCRQECCRTAATRYVKRLRMDNTNRQPRMIPSGPTFRRIKALQADGWSYPEIGQRIGMQAPNIREMIQSNRPTVRRSIAESVATAYASMGTPPPEPKHIRSRLRNAAKRAGWLPPLAWDDIDAGVIATADTTPDDTYIDHAAVERVLAGDYRIPTTPAERTVIVQRWVALGRTVNELERATGWRPSRYWSVAENRKGAA